MPQVLDEWIGYCHRTEINQRSGKRKQHNKWWAACILQDDNGSYRLHTLYAGLGKKSSERIERFDEQGQPLTQASARQLFQNLVQEKQSAHKGYVAQRFGTQFGSPTPVTVPSFSQRFASSMGVLPTTAGTASMGVSVAAYSSSTHSGGGLSAPCSVCGTITPLLEGFCATCGMALTAQTGQTPPVSSAPVGQAAVSVLSPGPLPVSYHLRAGRYTVEEKVGEGGMGAVYKVRDQQFAQRVVALKELVPDARLNAQQIQEAEEAFKQEAMLLAPLSHQSLPRIYDHFIEVGRSYLVMDYIEGKTLERQLEDASDHRLPLERVLQLGIDLSDVLDYLHAQQPSIIFRDLKPGNVMVTPRGHVYLIDFGIARLFKAGQKTDTVALGSPGYAAPEQYGKAQSSAKTDLYGLGATLHHALTGMDPSDNPFHFSSFPPQIEQVAGLEDLILGLVKFKVEDRMPESAAEVKTALQNMLAHYIQLKGHTAR